MEDAAGRELLSALDDRDPSVIRAAMVSYADRVQGVRLQAKAYDLVARLNDGKAAWSKCLLGSTPARLLRLLRARLVALGGSPLQEEADPLGAQPLPRVLEPATSKAAISLRLTIQARRPSSTSSSRRCARWRCSAAP